MKPKASCLTSGVQANSPATAIAKPSTDAREILFISMVFLTEAQNATTTIYMQLSQCNARVTTCLKKQQQRGGIVAIFSRLSAWIWSCYHAYECAIMHCCSLIYLMLITCFVFTQQTSFRRWMICLFEDILVFPFQNKKRKKKKTEKNIQMFIFGSWTISVEVGVLWIGTKAHP